ncbi:hypothetical protein ACFVR1_17710 [Psychrobacillus sp. NPDC058041]|uniref:hypothetical protein n=1 Tax=Psychrobacillus sp. NPDC058041 TaxID=3346310 RepID=UPI0036DF1A0C
MRDYVNMIKTFLPQEATILELQHPQKRPAILVADIDGDNIEELFGAYKYKEQNYLLGLKIMNNLWHPFIHIRGNGYGVSDLMAAPITDNGTNTLIVGWQIGSLWSELNLLKWTKNGFVGLTKSSIVYSKLEVEDMPGKHGRDGLYEVAIWIHDTGEAYKVNVYRYSKGKLVQAKDVYPYYFKKVEAYYKKLLQTNDYPYYWYYLADAQKKAGDLEQSLDSIEKTLSFASPYPSRQKLIDIKQQILSCLKVDRSNNQEVIDKKRGNVTGQGFMDTIYLTGKKTDESPFWQNITLVISNEKANLLERIPLKENAGYNPTIFLGNFTGDYIEDILVVIDTGGSGGIIYAYIFSFMEGKMRQIFNADEYNERTKYDVNFQNQYKATVISSIPKKLYLLDLIYKGKEYLTEIYNEDGTLKQPITGWVDPIGGLYPIDFAREGTYELIAFQEIAGRYHADGLGYIENVLKWNGHEFVSDRQSVSIFGEDLPPG